MNEPFECPNCHVRPEFTDRDIAAVVGRNREAAMRALSVEEKGPQPRFGFRVEQTPGVDGRLAERWVKTG